MVYNKNNLFELEAIKKMYEIKTLPNGSIRFDPDMLTYFSFTKFTVTYTQLIFIIPSYSIYN